MSHFLTKTQGCKSSKPNFVVPPSHQTSISVSSQKPPTVSPVQISASSSKERQKWPSKNLSPLTFNAKNKQRSLAQMRIWIWKIQFLKSHVNISKRQCNMLDEVLVRVI